MSAIKELIDILVDANTDLGNDHTYEDRVDNHSHGFSDTTIANLKHLQSRIAPIQNTTRTQREQGAERILFMVRQCINYAKREGTLPDVFDEQLCEGIETFFRGRG